MYINFRARPVVKMIASVTFSAEQKQVILEERNCTLKDYSRVSCLSLSACLEYQGIGVDDRLGKTIFVLRIHSMLRVSLSNKLQTTKINYILNRLTTLFYIKCT